MKKLDIKLGFVQFLKGVAVLPKSSVTIFTVGGANVDGQINAFQSPTNN